MKKLSIILMTAILLLVSQMAVFASPDFLSPNATGNSTGLVVVTRPQNQKESTFSESYIISGYGKEDTVVTLYTFDAENNEYKKFYTERKYIDENGASQLIRTASEAKIGSSGLFMNQIVLRSGENHILVRAENGDQVQLMKLSITKYNYNIIDLIKSLTD